MAGITQTKLQNRLKVEKLGCLVKLSISLASCRNCKELLQLEEIMDDDNDNDNNDNNNNDNDDNNNNEDEAAVVRDEDD